MSMSTRDLSGGPTAEAVRRNVRELREAVGLTYAEMSRRLDSKGHPLAVLALRRIEDGERRITVDDLCALASALGVSPNALLHPGPLVQDPEGAWSREPSLVTGVRNANVLEIVRWLAGFDALPDQQGDDLMWRAAQRTDIELPEGGVDELKDDGGTSMRGFFRLMAGFSKFGVAEAGAEAIYKLWDEGLLHTGTEIRLKRRGDEVTVQFSQAGEDPEPGSREWVDGLVEQLSAAQRQLRDAELRLRSLRADGESEDAGHGDD